jgi:hypothetical protein
VDEALPELPEPQRAALEVALLRTEATGPAREQLAVSLAGLGVLRAIARSSPVLLALDDLQWLDGSSARVLGFALRRLRDEPIGVMASIRLGVPGGDRLALDRTLPAHRIHRLFVRPMTSEALGHLISERTGMDLPRPILRRVDRLAGGNPFFALEIARELARRGIPVAGESLPFPDDLRNLLRARLEALPKTTRRLLLAVSATARATEQLVAATSGSGRPSPLPPRAGRVVRIEGGRIGFTHPLLASTVYQAASSRDVSRSTSASRSTEDRKSARTPRARLRGPARRRPALDEPRSRSSRGAPDALELSELPVA